MSEIYNRFLMRLPFFTGRKPTEAQTRCRLPSHFYIDIGNVCNLECPFCVTGNGTSGQSRGFMRLSAFSAIFEKIKGSARFISLYNWGEPLLNKDLIPIIELVARSRIYTHIDSNLASADISPAFAERIVLAGLRSLFASIDGAHQETYEIYRVKGDYKRALSNLELLARTKTRLGAKYPVLGWQYHVHKRNECDMDAARAEAARIGVPIVFRLLSTADDRWKSSYHVHRENIIESRDWFYSVYNPPQNPDIRYTRFHPNVSHVCRQLFQTMIIEWNGDVYPCTCVAGKPYALGNLRDQSLEEVWNGDKARKCREFILNYGPEQWGDSICENNSCIMVNKHAE